MAKRAPPLKIARSVASLRREVAAWRKRGDSVALVPTMGALHAGHMALVTRAGRLAKRTVVSLFVNPTQFGPHEDFAKYPRDEAADRAKLREAGVDLLFAPPVGEIYPEGFATVVSVSGIADGLDGLHRPGHFAGVATVVAKLLIETQADFALFGEKDYQQLRVVTRMARDLDLGVDVIGLATVRESDGLAMSSRNVYLSPEERATAPVLHRTMQDTAATLRAGDKVAAALAAGAARITKAGFALDYFEARHAETLQPIASLDDGPVRLLVAAKIGTTRLIDNIGV